MKEIKNKIAKIVKEHKGEDSYYKLRQSSGLTQQQIEAIETGEKAYTIDSLIKLCIALKLDLSIIPLA